MARLLLTRLLPTTFILAGSFYWLLVLRVDASYLCFLIFISLVFSASVVTLARRRKLWSWNEPFWVPPLVWAGYTMICFSIIGRILILPTDFGSVTESAAAGFLIWTTWGVLFDILAMEAGVFTIFNRAYFKKLGTIASAKSYGFYFFGSFGLISTLIAKIGYRLLIELSAPVSPAWTFVIGSAALSLPFLLFVATRKTGLERRRQLDEV